MIFELNFSEDPLDSILEKLSKSTLPEWMKNHYDFLKSYNDFNEYEIETSGTTGPPQILLVTNITVV